MTTHLLAERITEALTQGGDIPFATRIKDAVEAVLQLLEENPEALGLRRVSACSIVVTAPPDVRAFVLPQEKP